jgi:trehalose/maltose transport system permease protein
MTSAQAEVPRTYRFRRRRRSGLERRKTRTAWILLTPALVVVALVAFYPLGVTVYQSFTDKSFLALTPTKWIGLHNYFGPTGLIHDTAFRDALYVTLKFTAITVSFEFVLGLIIALVVNSSFKGRGVMRAVMLVPWAIPTVISARMWQWMFDDIYGVINDGLVRLHIIHHSIAWTSVHPLATVAAVDIWKTTPFVALLLLAGLQVIPTELYEAASVDGASKWQQFWRITLPLLRPAILVTLIFRTLDALRVFDVFYVFFGNRADTQTMAIYNQNTIINGDVGYGSAISVAIFLIIGIFVVIYVTVARVEQQ